MPPANTWYRCAAVVGGGGLASDLVSLATNPFADECSAALTSRLGRRGLQGKGEQDPLCYSYLSVHCF